MWVGGACVSCCPVPVIETKKPAGEIEDLALTLDNSSAAHLLVLAQDLDDLLFVLPQFVEEIRFKSIFRVVVEPVLGAATA